MRGLDPRIPQKIQVDCRVAGDDKALD